MVLQGYANWRTMLRLGYLSAVTSVVLAFGTTHGQASLGDAASLKSPRLEFKFDGAFLGSSADWFDAQAQGLDPFSTENNFSRVMVIDAEDRSFAVPRLSVVRALDGGQFLVGLTTDLREVANLVVMDAQGRVLIASHVDVSDIAPVRRYREGEFPVSHDHFYWFDPEDPVISISSSRGRLKSLTLRLDDGTPFKIDVQQWLKRSVAMRATFVAAFDASPLNCVSGMEHRVLFDRSASRWCHRNGVRNGGFERWNAVPNPLRVAVGGYEGGVRTGSWVEWRVERGTTTLDLVACYSHGLADGYAFTFDSQAQIRSVESFRNGYLHGPALSLASETGQRPIVFNVNGKPLTRDTSLDDYQEAACGKSGVTTAADR